MKKCKNRGILIMKDLGVLFICICIQLIVYARLQSYVISYVIWCL